MLFTVPAASSRASAQEDLATKYPEAEGLYEMTVPGQGLVVLQVYFKDGTLRTVTAGDAESTTFSPVEGHELRFAKTSVDKGTYLFELLRDEQGRLTRFRVVNEKLKLDVTGVKKAEFDDAKADPSSPSDRQGYFERHYRKSEHRVPMRDGVHLFTQVFCPVDASEAHPIILFRTPYGIPPYGEGLPQHDRALPPFSARSATSWSSRTSAAGPCPKAPTNMSVPIEATRRAPPTSTRAATPTTRWIGC
ncbi:MAG: hypothetical protein MZU79_04305 [Anaerotruncus sp.]|nr:hypothetical protein [Anaerotruncus sp.]